MRIAYFTSRLPWPPDRGDRLQALRHLEALASRHRVSLFSMTDGSEPLAAFTALEAICERVHAVRLQRAQSWLQAWVGLVGPTPSQVAFYRSSRMARLAEAAAQPGGFDVLYVHGMRMAPFVARLDHPAKFLMLTDAMSLGLRRSLPFQPVWRRPGVLWEERRVSAWESRITRCFRESWVVSDVDRDDLRERGAVRVETIPNGVDERLFDVHPAATEPPQAVFLGHLGVPHNVDGAEFAALQVWPHVLRDRPDARLRIVGAGATARVLRLAEAEGVEVTGRVSDLADVWRSARVMISPLRFSSGMQNKVLEAMAAGVPVVTTPPVADGLGARDGSHLVVAEGEKALAHAVLTLFRDPVAARRIGDAGRAFVRATFRWSTIVERIEMLAAGAREGAPSASAPGAG